MFVKSKNKQASWTCRPHVSFPENISRACSFFSRVLLVHSMMFLTAVWNCIFNWDKQLKLYCVRHHCWNEWTVSVALQVPSHSESVSVTEWEATESWLLVSLLDVSDWITNVRSQFFLFFHFRFGDIPCPKNSWKID